MGDGGPAVGRSARAQRLLVAVALLCGLATVSGEAAAQSLEVAPISLEMSAGQRATNLTLVNHAVEGGVIQVRPFVWSQVNGEDRLEPTPDLLISPPFTTLGPGESQVVRVVLRQGVRAREESYRLLIDQLPPPTSAGSVRVTIRVSMPVFAEPPVRSLPRLTASVVLTGPHEGVLSIRNAGGRRAHLWRLALTGPGAPTKPAADNSIYVLAGGERRIALTFPDATPRPGATIHVAAKSDVDDVALDAPISPS